MVQGLAARARRFPGWMGLALGLLCQNARAQVEGAPGLQAWPGLWIYASETRVDGQPLEESLLAAPLRTPAAQRQIRATLQRHGLPQGWTPGLRCQTAQSLSLDVVVAQVATACPGPRIESEAGLLSFSGQCRTPVPVARTSEVVMADMRYSGAIHVVRPDEIRSGQRTRLVLPDGTIVHNESESVARWVGFDCRQIPAGLEPAWVQSLLR